MPESIEYTEEFTQLTALEILNNHFAGQDVTYLYSYMSMDRLQMGIILERKLRILSVGLFGVEPDIKTLAVVDLDSVLQNLGGKSAVSQ